MKVFAIVISIFLLTYSLTMIGTKGVDALIPTYIAGFILLVGTLAIWADEDKGSE